MKICKVEGCNNKYYAKGYCEKHYNQIRKHGKIKRTIYDSNEIVLHEGYVEMILYDKQCNEVGRTLIDIEDIDKVKKYKWFIHDNYVYCGTSKILLHRFIMNCPDDKVVDHINHNPLDNRKCNLRICSNQQNCMNANLSKNNTSGYTGVIWHKLSQKWQSEIRVDGKYIYLGLFINLKDAIEARKQAEIKYFGEYRNKE